VIASELRRLVISLSAMALLGAATAKAQSLPHWLPVIARPTLITLTGAQKEAVNNGVRAKLINPSSAEFEDVYFAAKGRDGVIVVCGKVLATTSTGFRAAPFIGKFTADGFSLLLWASTNFQAIAMEVHCERLDRIPAENLKDWPAVIEGLSREQ
jgi:hypothetical protein